MAALAYPISPSSERQLRRLRSSAALALIEGELDEALAPIIDLHRPVPVALRRTAVPAPRAPVLSPPLDLPEILRPSVVRPSADPVLPRVSRPKAANPRARRRIAQRLRSLVVGFATVGILAALWVGASGLAALHDHPLAVISGTTRTANGYLYRVQPGDTLWSIAQRLDPTGDPRPVVDQLSAELHGATLQPGEQILLP